MSLQPPSNFIIFNQQNAKALAVVVDIEGLDYLTSNTVSRPIEFGDLHLYGETGLTFGETVLVPLGSIPGERQQRNLLILDSSTLVISQTLEPESGRASISTMSMTFVDKDQYLTKAVASGPIVPEILGRQVKIWLGFQNTTFPGDYYVCWRGRIGQVNAGIGKITLQFVDPNVVRRQQIFYTAQTTLSSDISSGATTIPVTANGSFHQKIAGPSGAYDTTVRTFLKIDNEFIEYQNTGNEATGFGTNQFLNCSRGVSPTGINSPGGAASHTSGTTVDSYVMLTDNIMSMALKIMMSGWGGPYKSNQSLLSFVATPDTILTSIAGAVVLPYNVDAIRDLGIAIGDYITISGATVGANNITTTVTGFQDLQGQTNRGILTAATGTLASETGTPAVIAIRSQYDVYPDSCGAQLPGWEVDVAQFQYLFGTFLSQGGYTFRNLINSADSAKTFIENELLYPVGAYSLTRQGKISVGLTKPPIADQRSQILTISNIIDPQNITAQRGINNRKFFNEVDWEFDYGDDGNSSSVRKTLKSDSLNAIGFSSVMTILAVGANTAAGFLTIVDNRETWLFNRYARGSVLINLKTQLGIGNLIEVGDIVQIQDSGAVQIPNFTTGQRGIGSQNFEVLKRDLDLRTGITSLQVEGGTGSQVNDRYATISPSSYLASGSTSSDIIITESFGNPANEQNKWSQYIGLLVRVHDPTYSLRDGTTTFIGYDPTNQHALLLAPKLSFDVQTGDVLDIAAYPNDTNAKNQALYKLLHAFIDDSVTVQSGVNTSVFHVSAIDAGQFQVGFPILIHDSSYGGNISVETIITSATGSGLISVRDDLGFIPQFSYIAEYIGFLDGGQPYRLV